MKKFLILAIVLLMSGWCYAQAGNSGGTIVVKKSYTVDGNNIPLCIEYNSKFVIENGEKFILGKITNESKKRITVSVIFKLHEDSSNFVSNGVFQTYFSPGETKELRLKVMDKRSYFKMEDVRIKVRPDKNVPPPDPKVEEFRKIKI